MLCILVRIVGLNPCPLKLQKGYIFIYIYYKNVTRASINIKVSCEQVKFQFLVNCPFKGFLFFCFFLARFISQSRSGVRVSRGTPVCL